MLPPLPRLVTAKVHVGHSFRDAQPRLLCHPLTCSDELGTPSGVGWLHYIRTLVMGSLAIGGSLAKYPYLLYQEEGDEGASPSRICGTTRPRSTWCHVR